MPGMFGWRKQHRAQFSRQPISPVISRPSRVRARHFQRLAPPRRRCGPVWVRAVGTFYPHYLVRDALARTTDTYLTERAGHICGFPRPHINACNLFSPAVEVPHLPYKLPLLAP